MKKALVIFIGMVIGILISVLGIKAIKNIQYAARIDDIEEWIDQEYGVECHLDYDNLLVTEQGLVSNILDDNGEHVDFIISYY